MLISSRRRGENAREERWTGREMDRKEEERGEEVVKKKKKYGGGALVLNPIQCSYQSTPLVVKGN